MKDAMKIKNILVKDLFDTFTHEIEFNFQEGITLILGQNGLGKTMVLKIIQAVLEGNFIYLENIQFSLIKLEFENNISWEIERIINEENFSELFLRKLVDDEKIDEISIAEISENYEKYKNAIRKYLPTSFRRVEEDEWFDRQNEIKYTTKELTERFKDYIPKNLSSDYIVYPEWYSEVIDNQEIFLIETQRLITISREDEYKYRRPSLNYRNTVEEYSEQLIHKINFQLATSSELATKLDRTYPNRLIERLKNTSNISQKELNDKLSEIEGNRARLQKVGLLDLQKEPNLKFIKEQDETIREVLLVYIEDSQKKLHIYDDLASRIELFLKIINERFLKKKLSISKDEGFHFESTKTKKTIPVQNLSSGEQHLLVLFYQLLFKIKEGTLLLIDEPEISLHISWQKRFISDLKDILKLNKVEIVIATHSPAIIGKDWDLTVELDAE